VLKKYLKDIKHLNIYKHGWRFQFGKSREWAGLCSEEETTIAKAKDKNIYVSIDFVKHDKNWKENMTQTIHHEISHAIVRTIFSGAFAFELYRIDEYHRVTKGHGKIWQLVCKKIFGSECSMYYNNANFGDSFKPYFYDCGKCENIEYGASPSFVTNCTKCGNAIIVQQN
jgi:predicted SprT family Zn-dependent metalloprotease